VRPKRTLVLITLFFIGINFQNCCTCEDVDEFFDIQNMSISYVLIDQLNSSESIDTLIEYEKLSHFRIDFDVDFISSIEDCFWRDFNTLSCAYGCDCEINGGRGSKEESIESISIITKFDFDSNHLINSQIDEIFWISPQLRSDKFEDLNNYIMTNNDLIRNQFLMLKLKERPTANTKFQFELILNLSTGEQYVSESQTFEFI